MYWLERGDTCIWKHGCLKVQNGGLCSNYIFDINLKLLQYKILEKLVTYIDRVTYFSCDLQNPYRSIPQIKQGYKFQIFKTRRHSSTFGKRVNATQQYLRNNLVSLQHIIAPFLYLITLLPQTFVGRASRTLNPRQEQ